jgi:hypothetical protein
MSNTRTDQRTLVEQMEEELNQYSSFTKYFTYDLSNSTTYHYQIPPDDTGWYKIECWNANGSGQINSYTIQTVFIKEKTNLTITLGSGSNYVSRVCNSTSGCTSSGPQLIASSGQLLSSRGPNWLDPSEFELYNDFTYLSNSRFLFENATMDSSVSNYGRVRITLVSKNSSYTIVKNTGNPIKAGTYYIMEANANVKKVLGYNVPTQKDYITTRTLMFQEPQGLSTQKWVYDPVNHSIINHDNHYSIRAETKGMVSDAGLYADSTFDNRSFEKWVIEFVSNEDTCIQSGTCNAQKVRIKAYGVSQYMYHAAGQNNYYGTKLTGSGSYFYLIPAN